MYFSRISINARAVDPDELVALAKGDIYAIHQILWHLFPSDPDADRDFIFREEAGNGWPFFYMVSQRRPDPLDGLVNIETKSYQPRLSEGQRLSFSLRANPVVTKKTANGKRVRHDVVMDAKRKIAKPFSANTDIASCELEHDAGIKWLEARADKLGFGFDPGMVRVFGYRQHHFKSRKRKDAIRFSSLDFGGLLTVKNANRFGQTLLRGIGRAKAFGCGLMLVRRA